ncbi:MAG: hypothetical protein ACRKGH_08750 [Dehalogenimonas sp.]
MEIVKGCLRHGYRILLISVMIFGNWSVLPVSAAEDTAEASRLLPSGPFIQGDSFIVHIDFVAPIGEGDGIYDIELCDSAPDGWAVSNPDFSPKPKSFTVAGNTVTCNWDAPPGKKNTAYSEGTQFSVSYSVTIPLATVPNTGIFYGSLLYHTGKKGVINEVISGGDSVSVEELPVDSPEASTLGATVITATSAVLNGNISSLGTASSILVNFEWGLTSVYGYSTLDQVTTATGSINAIITGLSPDTIYHFRIRAMGDGEVIGADQVFVTSPISIVPPSVTTSLADEVTTGSAVLNGHISSLGTAPSVLVNFEWGLTPAYGTSTVSQVMAISGSFSNVITDLVPNTTYHFRAQAIGAVEVIGADQTFTTAAMNTITPIPNPEPPVFENQFIMPSELVFPVRVGVIVFESYPGAGSTSEMYQSIEQVLGANRIPWDVLDITGGKSLDLTDGGGVPKYSCLIILAPGFIISDIDSWSIINCAKLGTGVVGVAPDMVNSILAPVFGISKLGVNWIASDGMRIEVDEFTFAYAGEIIKQSGSSLLDHRLMVDSLIIARDVTADRPAIWTHRYGASKNVFFNDTGIQSRYFQGILLQSILYSMPMGLGSPVNAGAVQVDDTPRAYYSSEYLQEFYYDYLNNFIDFLDAYNLTSTVYVVFSYSGQTTDFWLYPESVEGVYKFLVRGDEIGWHCGNYHIPLVTEYWDGETAINTEISATLLAVQNLAQQLQSKYGVDLGKIVSYVPPMNEIGSDGYQGLDALTDIKYVGTQYDFGVVDDTSTISHITYENFGWEAGTEIYNLPRTQGDFYTFSGQVSTEDTNNAWATLRSVIESGQAYLIFTHPPDENIMDPTKYPDFTMADLFEAYTVWADYVITNYPFYRWMTTAEVGGILDSRAVSLNSRWVIGENTLEIMDYSPGEALQIKTALFLQSISLVGTTLKLYFGDSVADVLSPEYDVIKEGNNYFIYPSGSKDSFPVIPGTPFVFENTEPPVVETNGATHITDKSAVLNGRVNELGSGKVVEVFFEWGLTPSYGNFTEIQTLNSVGPFAMNITGLEHGVTYYFRARANAEGISIGTDASLIPVEQTIIYKLGSSFPVVWFVFICVSLAAVFIVLINTRKASSRYIG